MEREQEDMKDKKQIMENEVKMLNEEMKKYGTQNQSISPNFSEIPFK